MPRDALVVGVGQPAGDAPDRAERALRARIAEVELQLAERDRQLAERDRQLEAVTRELDGLSYAAAHDLRSPLRALDGFSTRLRALHEADLSPSGRHYLDAVQRNARQLGRLIDGLLDCSRVARQPLRRRDVRPREIVDRVLADLRAEQDGRRLDIRIGDLVPCRADARLLERVFSGLISNALRFTRGREIAMIEIMSPNRDGVPTYAVTDNGCGFDMQYADKLFGLFQRLHDPTEDEGIGVGLAICQRIVGRHGGRIWADSAPDRGTTVSFTVPADGSDVE
jgi:light-regulated signal transduction histidine kinase (bacteriophytochrome)